MVTLPGVEEAFPDQTVAVSDTAAIADYVRKRTEVGGGAGSFYRAGATPPAAVINQYMSLAGDPQAGVEKLIGEVEKWGMLSRQSGGQVGNFTDQMWTDITSPQWNSPEGQAQIAQGLAQAGASSEAAYRRDHPEVNASGGLSLRDLGPAALLALPFAGAAMGLYGEAGAAGAALSAPATAPAASTLPAITAPQVAARASAATAASNFWILQMPIPTQQQAQKAIPEPEPISFQRLALLSRRIPALPGLVVLVWELAQSWPEETSSLD